MKRFPLCLLLFANLIPDLPAQERDLQLQEFTVEDGLSSTWVLDMLQDQQGFIWIGTMTGGLNRFDGYDFKVYKHDPEDSTSISDNDAWRLLEDREGNLWILTENWLNWYDRDRDRFIRYNLQNDGIKLGIPVMYEDHDQTLWIAGKHLYVFDRERGEFQPKGGFTLDYQISCLYEDRRGNFWAMTQDAQLLLLNKRTGKIINRKRFTQEQVLAIANVSSIAEDAQGALYVAAGTLGLFVLDPVSGEWTHFAHDEHNPNGLQTKVVRDVVVDRNDKVWLGNAEKLNRFDPFTREFQDYSAKASPAFEDKQGNLWLNGGNMMWKGGVYRLDNNPAKFQHVEKPGIDSGVMQFYEREDGTLWVGTWGQGFYLYDPVQDSLIQHFENPKIVYSLMEDRDQNVWVGSPFNGGLYKYDLKTRQLTHYPYFGDDPNSTWDGGIWTLYQDKQGRIWTGCGMGLGLYDPELDRFTQEFDFPAPTGPVTRILEDQTGELWVEFNDSITFTGKLMPVSDPEATYTHQHNTHWITEDPQGNFWGNNRVPYQTLMFIDRQTDFIKYYGDQEGLPANQILSLQADHWGSIWLGTDKGLVRFDPATEQFKLFDSRDGMPLKGFDFRSRFKTRYGQLYFGGANGFIHFHPDSIQPNTFVPPVVMTEFLIDNQTMDYRDSLKGRSVLNKSIERVKQIRLPYGNNFSLKFAALNYLNSQKNQYAYQMEGFDQDWISAGTNRTATYTNLYEGSYTFRVKASNNDGIWNEEGTSIKVVILPPWWRSWWAYSLYGFLVLGTILSLRHYELKRYRLRQRAKHLAELDRLKTSFFANISHEFRTPLTLILGPVRKLLERQAQSDDQPYLRSIHRNAERLLHLVNQLLDLSKLEAGKLKLETVKTDIVAFLRLRANAFSSLGEHKHIRFLIKLPDEKIGAYFDQDKLEKIINNLLSNAFKFTPEDGSVRFTGKTLREGGKAWFQIQVADTGPGIPAEAKNKIFDRFYQVDNFLTRAYEGTGIGLALTKELVELHRGTLEVESALGEGSTFTIRLPLGKTHLTEAEIIQELPWPASETEDANLAPLDTPDLALAASSEPKEAITNPTADKPIVLIVEDHPEMRAFINQTLHERYEIQEAEDGLKGLAVARDLVPDLIISDVMMPQMDGYQLCEQVKTNELTSHIPIILLTAKADRQSKLAGLEIGADDYLSKPFDADELRLIVRNRIVERQIMHEHFSRQITLEPKSVQITSVDERFLQRVMHIVESHLADSFFGVEKFAQEVGMSRAQLFRKLKALTGHTPGDFVRIMRLKRGANLLAQGAGNIADIAYQVGFQDPSYFTKCFQKQFGQTPSEFLSTHIV